MYGQPIEVGQNASTFEEKRLLVETTLNQETEKVENEISRWDQYSRDNWFVGGEVVHQGKGHLTEKKSA